MEISYTFLRLWIVREVCVSQSVSQSGIHQVRYTSVRSGTHARTHTHSQQSSNTVRATVPEARELVLEDVSEAGFALR